MSLNLDFKAFTESVSVGDSLTNASTEERIVAAAEHFNKHYFHLFSDIEKVRAIRRDIFEHFVKHE